MDKKTYAIGILSITAVILFVTNLLPVQPPVAASEAIKERDFTVVTTRATQGGDALYICDNRTGMIAVFTWDPTARGIKLRDLRPVMDAFQ
jgi:hypothetical protein